MSQVNRQKDVELIIYFNCNELLLSRRWMWGCIPVLPRNHNCARLSGQRAEPGQDRPTASETKRVNPNPTSENQGRRTMKEPVKMYSLSTCSHCNSTKKFPDRCAVKYEFTDIDLLDGKKRSAIVDDIKRWNPRSSFPTIIIGDKVIIGYRMETIPE